MNKIPINIEDIEQLIVQLEAVTMKLREHTTRHYMEQAEDITTQLEEDLEVINNDTLPITEKYIKSQFCEKLSAYMVGKLTRPALFVDMVHLMKHYNEYTLDFIDASDNYEKTRQEKIIALNKDDALKKLRQKRPKPKWIFFI